MITNVSDIINNIFEKIFENPEISFSHPNRTFQYAVRHGKLNEDYLVLNEDTLERKLKTGIAQAIVKEFPFSSFTVPTGSPKDLGVSKLVISFVRSFHKKGVKPRLKLFSATGSNV